MAPNAMPTMFEPTVSYRERLRAGGRAAFQRAIDAGLVPKNMKQEWCATQPSAMANSYQEFQNNNMGMQYGSLGDGQQMWNAMGQAQTGNCWQQVQMPMQAPTFAPHHHMQPQMAVPMMSQMQPQPAQVQAQVPMFEMPMCQMQVPPQAQSCESTPTDFDRCMAICMPQTAQFDKDLMAAQLKAAADCQRYED